MQKQSKRVCKRVRKSTHPTHCIIARCDETLNLCEESMMCNLHCGLCNENTQDNTNPYLSLADIDQAVTIAHEANDNGEYKDYPVQLKEYLVRLAEFTGNRKHNHCLTDNCDETNFRKNSLMCIRHCFFKGHGHCIDLRCDRMKICEETSLCQVHCETLGQGHCMSDFCNGYDHNNYCECKCQAENCDHQADTCKYYVFECEHQVKLCGGGASLCVNMNVMLPPHSQNTRTKNIASSKIKNLNLKCETLFFLI